MSSTISQEVYTFHPDFLMFYSIELHYGFQRGIEMDNAEICSTNLLEHLRCARRYCPAFKGFTTQCWTQTEHRSFVSTEVVTAGCYSVTGAWPSLHQAELGRGFKTVVGCFWNKVRFFNTHSALTSCGRAWEKCLDWGVAQAVFVKWMKE